MSSSQEEEEEGVTLDFDVGFMNDLLDDVEEEAKPNLTRCATRKELNALTQHIGGLEKWRLVDKDFKIRMLGYLDYASRVKLGRCSKTDYALVNETKISVNRIEMVDDEKHHYQLQEDPFDNVVVGVQFTEAYNGGDRFELIFSQLGEHTQIRWMKYVPRQRPVPQALIRENCDYYEEAVKFAEHWMKRANFKLKGIKVEMHKYPMASSIVKSLPACTDVRIGVSSEPEFHWWLEKVPEHLESLQLVTPYNDRDTFTLSSPSLLARPQIVNASRFYFWCRAAFTDDQFLGLRARRMSFDATAALTDDGINAFLRRWARGDGVDGFKEALLWSTREVSQERVLRGLDVRPWDEAFEEEAAGFCSDFARCCGRGAAFQISSRRNRFESLTVSIDRERLMIAATGTEWHRNGEPYTDYSIP